MPEFKSFQEYLNANKKLVTAPKVTDTPDYDGPTPASPPAAEKKKDAGGANTGGGGKPYTPATSPVKGKKGEKGFADEGPKDLVYEPDTKLVGDAAAGGKKVSTWPTTKTQEWINQTKNLSLADFVKQVSSGLNEHCGCENKEIPHVVAYAAGPFHPDPLQAIQYVTYLSNVNENILSTLVREAKRSGLLPKIVEELLEHQETYETIVENMEGSEGERYSRRLVRAMNETYVNTMNEYAKLYEVVAPPAHQDEIEDDEEDEDFGPPDNVEGEEFPPGEEDEDDMGDEEDLGDEDDMGDKEMGDEEMGDEMGGGEDMMSDPSMGDMPPMPKKRKKFPHHHLINAMKDHPPMANAMKDALGMGGNNAGI